MYIGDTPFEQLVPQGQYLFKIEKENYDPEITIISVKEGKEKTIEIPLSFSQLYKERTLSKYQVRKKTQNLIRYGSLIISLASAYYAFDRYQNAQSHYDSYSLATDVAIINQTYDNYELELKSFNVFIGVSVTTSLIGGWTFLKPVSKPDFLD